MLSEKQTKKSESQVQESSSWQYYENIPKRQKRSNNARRKQASDWLLQDAMKQQDQDKNGYLKKHRICTCGQVHYQKSGAKLTKTSQGIKAKGLQYCESVSTCPICSGLILNERSKEIDLGMKNHLENGGSALMLTLTVSHSKYDSLSSILTLEQAAYSSLIANKMHGLEKTYGIIGRIKRLETRYGQINGWHPHYHVLLPIDRDLSDYEVQVMKDEIFYLWHKYVKQNGGSVNKDHGIDLSIARNLEQVGRYISKELTAQGDLKTNSSSMDPFELLDVDTPENKKLFLEYAHAMKGKHVISWSRGLKEKLGVKNQSDKEILEKQNQTTEEDKDLLIIEKAVYNRIRNNFELIDYIAELALQKDYDLIGKLIGCKYYSAKIKEHGITCEIPYFVRI